MTTATKRTSSFGICATFFQAFGRVFGCWELLLAHILSDKKKKLLSSICDTKCTIISHSLSILTQKYLRKWRDAYFILQNKYLCIYEDSFGAKILRNDCTLNLFFFHSISSTISLLPCVHLLIYSGFFPVLKLICTY